MADLAGLVERLDRLASDAAAAAEVAAAIRPPEPSPVPEPEPVPTVPAELSPWEGMMVADLLIVEQAGLRRTSDGVLFEFPEGGDPVEQDPPYYTGLTVTANGWQDPNVPTNVLDGNPATRWSHDVNPTLTVELGGLKTVGAVEMSFHNGAARVFYHGIYASPEATGEDNFVHVFEGESSGQTVEFESFNFADITARRIRIVGRGNDGGSNWTSITELRVASGDGGGSPHPVPPAAPATAPAVSLQSTTDTTASFGWPTVTDATGYRIRHNGVVVATTTATSYTVTGLAPSTSGSVEVQGYNATGNGPWSTAVPYTTDAASSAPADWQAAWDTSVRTTVRNWFVANTGCRIAEGSLVQSGGISTTHDGQVISGRHIVTTGYGIRVRHRNVVIRDCIIESGNKGIYVDFADWDSYFNATVEYVSFPAHPNYPSVSGNTARNAIDWTYGGALTARYCHVNGRYQGFFLTANCLIEYCMIENLVHGSWNGSTDHNTGISTRRGTGTRINRCWIEGNSSTCVSLYPDQSKPSRLKDFRVTQSVLEQGNYHVFGGAGKTYAGEMTDVKFLDNRHSPYVEFCWKDNNNCYGIWSGWVGNPGNERTGNRYWDGTPV